MSACNLAAAANITVCFSNARANSSAAGFSNSFLLINNVHGRSDYHVSGVVSVVIPGVPGIFQLFDICQSLKAIVRFWCDCVRSWCDLSRRKLQLLAEQDHLKTDAGV